MPEAGVVQCNVGAAADRIARSRGRADEGPVRSQSPVEGRTYNAVKVGRSFRGQLGTKPGSFKVLRHETPEYCVLSGSCTDEGGIGFSRYGDEGKIEQNLGTMIAQSSLISRSAPSGFVLKWWCLAVSVSWGFGQFTAFSQHTGQRCRPIGGSAS